MFERFDYDHKGYIEMNDLIKMSKELGENLSENEIEQIFNNCSLDKKKITFDEFYNIMTGFGNVDES